MSSRYARPLDLSDLNAHTYGVLSVPPGSRVLDVGTADGRPVAETLTTRGCTVVGVEYDAADAELARQWCERVVVGDVERLDLAAELGDDRFDRILCLDVLEHLVEPATVLRRLAGFLAPGGRIVISLPNISHAAVRLQLLGGKFTYTDTGLLDRTHLRFFDRAGARQLLVDAALVSVEELAVLRAVHETEIEVDRDALPEGALAAATADPDSAVFQWVLVAAPNDTPVGTGLATALFAEVGTWRTRTSEALDHIEELRALIAAKDGHEARQHANLALARDTVAELGATLTDRMAELLAASESIAALRADLAVKDDYVAELLQRLGDLPFAVALPSDDPTLVRAQQLAVRAVRELRTHPQVWSGVHAAARAARQARALRRRSR